MRTTCVSGACKARRTGTGTGVMDGCELPCGYQGLNLAPLLVLITTEPALLPLICLAFEVVFS